MVTDSATASVRAANARRILAWRRLFDLRNGERGTVLKAFAVFGLIVLAQTVFETGRDVSVVSYIPLDSLGWLYIVVAACAIPAASIMTRASARSGARLTLARALGLMALLAACLKLVPNGHASAIALYLLCGLTGALLAPQFWVVLGAELSVEQSGRLLGMIGMAGIFGAIVGSSSAALLVAHGAVGSLLIAGSAMLVLASALTVARRSGLPLRPPAPEEGKFPAGLRRAFAEEPLLFRVALVVALMTATVLSIDYFFKWTIIRALPPASRIPFVARFNALQNIASLLVQVLLGRAILRRYGVASSTVVTPLLILTMALGSLATGGATAAVLAVKCLDGSLRNSVHRVVTELVYLPIPLALRQRVKPFIDGALVRAAQAASAGAFLALGALGWLSPVAFAAIVAALSLAWTSSAVALRRPYVGVLRRAVSLGAPTRWSTSPISADLESAQVLAQRLASDDALEVAVTLDALGRRAFDAVIPALILLYDDEVVVIRALEIFARSSRSDWYALARKKLNSQSEKVSFASVRALSRHGQLDWDVYRAGESAELRGYAALQLALRDRRADAGQSLPIAALLTQHGDGADRERIGVLQALLDLPPDPRLHSLLEQLANVAHRSDPFYALLATAAARHGYTAIVPELIEGLMHPRRERIARGALVQLGSPAFEQLGLALSDHNRDRVLRARIPEAVALFGTPEAASLLLQKVESEADGLVRYHCLRALTRLADEHRVRVDRRRVERLALADLDEYFRLLAQQSELVSVRWPVAEKTRGHGIAKQLLVGLLEDKQKQSLERVFRLLKLANPSEDVHRVYRAIESGAGDVRGNAAAFLDAMLWHRDQRTLRSLLRVVVDQLPADERLARARPHLSSIQHVGSAFGRLDVDPAVSALAAGLDYPAVSPEARSHFAEIPAT